MVTISATFERWGTTIALSEELTSGLYFDTEEKIKGFLTALTAYQGIRYKEDAQMKASIKEVSV